MTHDASIAACALRLVTVRDGLIASDVPNPRRPAEPEAPRPSASPNGNGAGKPVPSGAH